MKQQILIDTSPIVAILSPKDTYHQICVDTLKILQPPLITCWAVITEVVWLIRKNKIGINALFTMMEGNLLQVIHLPQEATPWLKSYMMNYPQSSLRFDWGFCRFNSQSLANPPHRFDVCFCSED